MTLLLLSPFALISCTESNQSRSARIAKGAKSSGPEKRLTIDRRNVDIDVKDTAIVSGDGGTTVVAVKLTNNGGEQSNVPLIFDAYGRGKKSLYRNNEPGLQESLQRVGSIKAGETLWWVNDQLPSVTGVRRISAKVGPGQKGKSLPSVKVSNGRLLDDPSGVFIVGDVKNTSKRPIVALPIFAVATSGSKVVAAGRAIVQKIGASKSANYRILLAGDPAGAKLSIYAAPKPN